MSTQYIAYSSRGGGSGGGVTTYPTFSSFPASAPDGTLAVALNTDTLYIYSASSMAWLPIASPGDALAIGTFDSGVASANGAHIDANMLIMQSATTLVPGLVNNSTQSFSGNKTFTGSIVASNFTGSSSGTNTGDVTLGTANGLSLSGQVLGLGLASTSTTGALDSTDWNTFNSKQSALTLGNLSDTGVDGITVTGGTGAVVGSGTVIAQQSATTSRNGYLTSTDWNTFNSKQSIITTGDLTESGSPNLSITGGSGAVIGSGTILTLTGASIVESGSSVLTFTGGTNAVLGTGVSVQVTQATMSTSGYLSFTDWNTFDNKQAAGNYITALTGDGTASGPGSAALTLATVNTNVGSFGSSTAIPSFTVNAKGLITAASTNAVVAPASTLTGTTLASNVVSSSLTSVGTITSGTWNGTAITVPNGGTGRTTLTQYGVLVGNGTSAISQLPQASIGQVLTGQGATNPVFTSSVQLGSTALGLTGILSLAGRTSGVVQILPQDTFSNYNFNLPTTPGTSGQVLTSGGGSSNPMTWTTPASGGAYTPTVTTLTSGSGTFTTPANASYITVQMVGGGGGGASSSGGSGSPAGNPGGAGGNTTFGTSLLVANGGAGSPAGLNASAIGGTASLGSGPVGVALQGAGGTLGSETSNASAPGVTTGGVGASTPFGGSGGAGGDNGGTGGAAIANTGSGGGGGGVASSVANAYSGGGGAAGGYVNAIIVSPASSYSYAVGAGGAAGAAGAYAGGAGGSGVIIITTYYNNGAVGTATNVTGVVAVANGGTGVSTVPQASYYISANQAVGSGVQINFDTEEFDTNSAVTKTTAGTSGTWKFTAPVAGTYLISAIVDTQNGNQVTIYKNGSAYKLISQGTSTEAASGTVIMVLALNDFIDLRPGSSCTVVGGALSGLNTGNVNISLLV